MISTHILTKRMTLPHETFRQRKSISTHILTKRMTRLICCFLLYFSISTHILTKRMTFFDIQLRCVLIISTHILTKRMTAILNKIFSFKIKLYIYSLFFISITLYYILFLPKNVHILVRMIQQITVHLPFALHVSLFHHCTSIFPSAVPLLGKLSCIHNKECIPFRFSAYGILY